MRAEYFFLLSFTSPKLLASTPDVLSFPFFNCVPLLCLCERVSEAGLCFGMQVISHTHKH